MSNINLLHWNNMQYDELKAEIVQVIMGQGMGGSTQYMSFIPCYFEKLSTQKLKDDVLQIITELLEEIENPVSSRAIYIFGELPITNKHVKIIEITQRIYPILDKVYGDKEIPESCMKYLDYICEINKIIGKLKIVEAKQFLEKQAKNIHKTMPSPMTNEYYVYHLSAKSAVESLKNIGQQYKA